MITVIGVNQVDDELRTALTFAGWMGHEFVRVRPTDDPVHGPWFVCCEANALRRAAEDAGPDDRIFQQLPSVRDKPRRWRERVDF